MIVDILIKAIKIFFNIKREKIRDESDLLYIKKRQLFHKNVPDLEIVKEIAGESYYLLLEIFNRFDPIKGENLKKNPNKYKFLTKTVLFKLPAIKSRQELEDFIALEFTLWFKHGYNNFKRKEELVEEVEGLHQRFAGLDPFESFRHNK